MQMNVTTILTGRCVRDRIEAMGAAGRRRACEAGELTRHELDTWASLYPEEVPLVNGELPWIVATLE